MDEKFICAVEEKNVKVVRMMLSNELLLDPRGGTFDEMLYYGKERLYNLFESNEPAKFDIPTDKEKWTDEVVSKMKRELNMNFSKGKLSVYSKMAKWAGRDKAEKRGNPYRRTCRNKETSLKKTQKHKEKAQ